MKLFRRGRIWHIDFMYKGKRYRYSLHTTQKSVAEEIKKQTEAKIALGQFETPETLSKIKLSEFFQHYIEYCRHRNSPKHIYQKKTQMNTILRYIGDPSLKDITPTMLEQYRMERLKNVGPAIINKEFSMLRHMFNYAVKLGYAAENPVVKVGLLPEPKPRVRFLTPEEFKMLMDAAPTHLKPIILLAVHTGLRKTELLSLKWENVDFKREVIVVENTKNRERRTIPLNSVALEVLEKLPKKSDYIFPSKKGRGYIDVKKSFRNAVKRAGIKNVHFHDLRHTFASYLVMSGVDLRTVQELLGHKSLRMVARYSHLSQEHLKKSVKNLEILTVKIQENHRDH